MKLKLISNSFIIIVLAIALHSCGKKTEYAYYENLPAMQVDKRLYPLNQLVLDKDIDILFVIDNSGSMSTIQENVIQNAKVFMEQFAKQAYINWKIGIISTDKKDAPYLGFETPFDWRLIDFDDPTSFDRTVTTFQEAVAKLGTDGSSFEYVFYNAKRALDLFPSFLRSNSHLVIIMISDEEEQSESTYGETYNASNFFKTMSQYTASNKILRFYGALSRKDLENCQANIPGDTGTYVGSPYEKVIKLSKGFNISACTKEFGVELAKIGKDIAALVGESSLLLRQRPVVNTIRVSYKGKLLPPGAPEKGGMWFYDDFSNTLNFYKLDFVEDALNDVIKIDFEVDDGYNRN